MTDIGDDFKILRQMKVERHEKWHKENKKILLDSGTPFIDRGEALLFRGKVKADFYPSTGRWRSGNKTYRGGAKSFLNWWRQKNPVNGLNQNMIIRDKASNMTVFDQQEEDWFDNDCKGEIGDY